MDGVDYPSIWTHLRQQIFLGSEEFVEEMQSMVARDQDMTEIPLLQRQDPPKPLKSYRRRFPDPKMAMAEAYKSGHHTMKSIAKYFEVHYTTVSRAVSGYQQSGMGDNVILQDLAPPEV